LPTNAIYLILQILKEIREEHDRHSDHSTALTLLQLETLASSTGVQTEPELMQVKCTSVFFSFFTSVTLYPYFVPQVDKLLTDESL